MESTLNKDIEFYIDSLKDGFSVTDDMVAFVSRYDKCDDFHISNNLVKATWNAISDGGLVDMTKSSMTSVLHTNSGAGKFLKVAPKKMNLTSYNLDFYCSTITGIVCDDRKRDFLYHSYNRDIAQYFFQESVGNNPKFDIVITQPKSDSEERRENGLNTLDSDFNFSRLPSEIYYALRSCFFLNKGGILVIVAKEGMKDKFTRMFDGYFTDENIKFNYKMKFVSELETSSTDGYNSYIFKNIGYGE